MLSVPLFSNSIHGEKKSTRVLQPSSFQKGCQQVGGTLHHTRQSSELKVLNELFEPVSGDPVVGK